MGSYEHYMRVCSAFKLVLDLTELTHWTVHESARTHTIVSTLSMCVTLFPLDMWNTLLVLSGYMQIKEILKWLHSIYLPLDYTSGGHTHTTYEVYKIYMEENLLVDGTQRSVRCPEVWQLIMY